MPRPAALLILAVAAVAAGDNADASSLLQHTVSSTAEAGGKAPAPLRLEGHRLEPSPEQASHLDDSDILKLQAATERLRARGRRSAALATFSSEFLSLANNFACSWLANAGSDAGLVLVALDGRCEGLSGSFARAEVECVAITSKVSPPSEAEHVKFKSPRYFFMTRMKLAVFSVWLDLVAVQEESKWLLLSDVDVVVNHDPFQYVNENYQLQGSQNAPPILCAPNTPSCPPYHNKSKINSGFCFYRAGADASSLLRSALAILVAGNSSDGADQGAIREAMKRVSGRDSLATSAMLPCKRFPIGRFFRNPEAYEDPVAIHANYMATDQKEPCFRASGKWFVADAPGATCQAGGPRYTGGACG